MKPVVFCTSNEGKLREVRKFATRNNIQILTLSDVGVELDVAEDGDTFQENAKLKAEAYSKILPEYVVCSDDSGLMIDALHGEPGPKTRRWNGTPMSDEAILNYCLEKMKNLSESERSAKFVTVICVAESGKESVFFEGEMPGSILSEPIHTSKVPGFPFRPVFHITEINKMLSEVQDSPNAQPDNFMTHREKALKQLFIYLGNFA